MAVFVLDTRKKPLMPCPEKRARQLLERRGRAMIHRMYPFTIRSRDRVGGALQPLEVRIDPGSKSTGVAVMRKDATTDTVLHLAQICAGADRDASPTKTVAWRAWQPEGF